jgi:hypothetical protein
MIQMPGHSVISHVMQSWKQGQATSRVSGHGPRLMALLLTEMVWFLLDQLLVASQQGQVAKSTDNPSQDVGVSTLG